MDYKNVNDYEIIYMIRENDEESRNLLLKKYMPIVNKVALKFLEQARGLGIEMDDLKQEAMIALDKAISGYDENTGFLFYTYAMLCVERHLITYFKKCNNKKNYFLNYSIADDNYELLSDNRSFVDDIASDSLIRELFRSCLDNFDLEYSSVFELRYNGFTYKEIGELLDISIGTVDARLSKVKKYLQRKYGLLGTC